MDLTVGRLKYEGADLAINTTLTVNWTLIRMPKRESKLSFSPASATKKQHHSTGTLPVVIDHDSALVCIKISKWIYFYSFYAINVLKKVLIG